MYHIRLLKFNSDSLNNPARFSCWMLVLLLSLVLVAGCGKKAPESDVEMYDKAARLRIDKWKTLIEEKKKVPVTEKLVSVNMFFNQLEFVPDISHWGQKDYWATPLETLVSNGGDCEDFTIAKYFTLKSLGVPEEKMRLTYVKSKTLNQAHMVLTYYQRPDVDPLVLDNLINEIVPASERKDLVPVYTFNGTGLWVAKSRTDSSRVGEASRLSLWQDLLHRVEVETSPL
jgi:predicted transglutaminase-like cysteine proteinase